MDRNQLHPLTKQNLSSFPNLRLDDQGFADLSELNGLAWDYTHPTKATNSDSALNLPLRVGPLYFWRPCIAVRIWLAEYVAQEFKPELFDLFALYACSRHPKQLDKLFNCRDRVRLRAKLFSFGLGLRLSQVDAESILTELFPSSSDEPENDGGGTYGELVLMLCREFGNTHKFWMYEASEDFILSAIQLRQDEVEQVEQARRLADAKSGSAKPPNPNSPSMKALGKFRAKLKEMAEKYA